MPKCEFRKEDIVKNKPDCEGCKDRSTCVTPCDAVERWIDQDRVGRNSNLVLENGSKSSSLGDEFLDLVNVTRNNIDTRDSQVSNDAWELIKSIRLSEKVTRLIYSYYMLGRRVRDIAISEGISSQAVDQRHFQAKRTIAKRLKRKSKWVLQRHMLEYKGIQQYDMSVLFNDMCLPRKVVSNVLGVNVSSVVKYIAKQNRTLADTRNI